MLLLLWLSSCWSSHLIPDDNFDHPVLFAAVGFATFGEEVDELVVGSNPGLGRHLVAEKKRTVVVNEWGLIF